MALNQLSSSVSDSNATLCPLRRVDRENDLQPLKQHPNSAVNTGELAEFDDVDIGFSLRPPPSALTSTSTHYDPHASALDDYRAPIPQSHQKTLTGAFLDNCQPFLNRATSTLQQRSSRASLPSPTKSLASFISTKSATNSTASQPKLRAGAKAFQSWFNGSSAPVTLGLSTASEDAQSESGSDWDSGSEEEDEDEEPTMMASLFNRGTALTSGTSDITPRRPAARSSETRTSTANSRFAWLLSTPKASTPSAPPPRYHNPDDELLNLNIALALLPHGPVDSLAPSSFNDLLSTAESLITRYQTSYRHLSTALQDARAEQSAQEDELDESETRNQHLKMQLETMAAKVTEQDAQIRRLTEELALERAARKDELAAKKNAESGKRTSNSHVSVDSGFESECESETASSVFSRNQCRSPTGTENSDHGDAKSQRPHLQKGTIDKLREGMADVEVAGWGCSNCEGGAQASVWARLAKEREESNELRKRLEMLEAAVDGALGIIP